MQLPPDSMTHLIQWQPRLSDTLISVTPLIPCHETPETPWRPWLNKPPPPPLNETTRSMTLLLTGTPVANTFLNNFFG
jgi:hypothetical protein